MFLAEITDVPIANPIIGASLGRSDSSGAFRPYLVDLS